MKQGIIQVTLIRHGRTMGNEEKRYIGSRTDESLSGSGIAQVRALRTAGVLPEADLLFSSPMKRCVETAAILYPDQKPVILNKYREIDFGDFEGHTAAELLADPDSGYQAWIDSNGTMTFPHGESRYDFQPRSLGGFYQMMWQCDRARGWDMEKSLCCAAVVHGGTIMSILQELFGRDYYDYMCANAEGFQMDLWSGENADWISGNLRRISADGVQQNVLQEIDAARERRSHEGSR